MSKVETKPAPKEEVEEKKPCCNEKLRNRTIVCILLFAWFNAFWKYPFGWLSMNFIFPFVAI